ncbi:MAG: hypothetical protein ABJO01_00960 [Parasphingorhabdus sp.]|uniref:hypothetical protein n=1 Tax=Parasphingorhabdus sp. TaxID=2709688 RepID=UPI00329895A9
MSDPLLQLDPLQRLISAYAKGPDRYRYALVFALDSRLADIIRSTSETLIGQMRLTWWRDILTTPIAQRPTGEPLVALINQAEERGGDPDRLQTLLEGWEYLLEDFPWTADEFDNYAQKRGEGLFAFAYGDDKNLNEAQLSGARAWALWDFARHCSDESMRDQAFQKCRASLEKQERPDFDRSGRPLSILCKLAADDVNKAALTADLYRPGVASKIIWHGVTGC